jgi:hypothetical protein
MSFARSITKKSWFSIIKYSMVLLAFGFIYHQVFVEQPYELWKNNIGNYSSIENLGLFAFVLVLMTFNWGLEAAKWKLLIKPLETISLGRSIRATLAGISAGLFTPNRIGEFGGRVFFLRVADKTQAILATVAGSFSQLLATIIIGSLGLCWYTQEVLKPDHWVYVALIFLSIITCVATSFIYFNMGLLSLLKDRKGIPAWIRNKLVIMKSFEASFLLKVLSLSVARYAIFTLQYILLLYIFNIHINILSLVAGISVIFLLQTAVPSITLLELGIRGSGAIGVLSAFSGDHIGIVLSAFTLWLINLIIPAIIGLVFISGLKSEMD